MNLGRVQMYSLITKGITTALGIVQSVIIVRVLTPGEFGLTGLVMSIGSVIGVSQHLGIVDGAIREIAIRKKKSEIGKVFWVSHIVRQAVTIPLSFGLALLAKPIAEGIYDRPEIVPYILLFSGVLILQGLQDVLGATLTGMKKFKELYAVQIITAAINVAVFGFLTWKYGVSGFFWAMIVTTSIMVVMLFYYSAHTLRGHLSFPTTSDIKEFGKRVMRIGAFMYLARIFLVIWQRLPLLVLGGVLSADELGYINVSLTFGSKLTIIAMALSEVNLAWMSSLYEHKRDLFTQQVTRNMHRVLVLMLAMTLVLLFFTPEILQYIIGIEYLPAKSLIVVMTTAFFLYALTDIGTSSVFVPADNPKLRTWVYGLLTGTSALLTAFILFIRPDAMLASLALLVGAAIGYAAMLALAYKTYRIPLLTPQLAVLLVLLGAGAWWLETNPPLLWRIVAFLALSLYTLWEAHKSNLLPRVGKSKETENNIKIMCFAGAAFHQPTWTNRQHIMSRVAERYPVLYIEPRVWIVRFLLQHMFRPRAVASFFRRTLWYERLHDNLYIKSQWNLIPGSRESSFISRINHLLLNRWNVLATARLLGFHHNPVIWIYDTEAAEYISAFPRNTVLYDCVDDHAAQAGADRNPRRVKNEERAIVKRANIVTVTSHALFKKKKKANKNTYLVLNAGDVALYSTRPKNLAKDLSNIPHPMIGLVGSLDSYKIDVEMIEQAAKAYPAWQFVCIGSPAVEKSRRHLKVLASLPNVHLLGTIDREMVPKYIYAFDVLAIPYRASRYNASSFPLKFWEFMATGKPIVVSGLPELLVYKDMINYVHNPVAFVRATEHILQEKGDKFSAQRKQLAREHSWEARTKQLLNLLEKHI